MPGQLFVISGPSGAGKSSIIRMLRKREPNLGYSISHTSREPREKELHGQDYYFVDRGSFEEMIRKKLFVEWACVYQHLYGTSFDALNSQLEQEQEIILDLDIQGAKNIKKRFKESTLVYILPPSLEELERRLKDRAQDDNDTIKRRMKEVDREIRESILFDFFIINDDLKKAVKILSSIIISNRYTNQRMMEKIKTDFFGKGEIP